MAGRRAFVNSVGRGRVLCTTLGAPGWTRLDCRMSHARACRSLPTCPWRCLRSSIWPRNSSCVPNGRSSSTRPEVFCLRTRSATRVVARSTVLLVSGRCHGACARCFSFIRKEGLEHLGWLSPALALVAAVVFVGLGEHSEALWPLTSRWLNSSTLYLALAGASQWRARRLFSRALPRAGWGGNGGAFEHRHRRARRTGLCRVQTDAKRWHWKTWSYPRAFAWPVSVLDANGGPVWGRFAQFAPEALRPSAAGPVSSARSALVVTPGRHALPVLPTHPVVFASPSSMACREARSLPVAF